MIALPLSRGAFWNILPIREMSPPTLPGTTKTPRTRGGELLPAEYGSRLWQGKVEIADLTLDEHRKVAPFMHLLQASGSSFFMDDRTRPGGPASDPNGSQLSGTSVQIDALVNARELTLRGLPAGFVLSTGDRISWSASGAVAFHEIVVGGSASSSGVTPAIELVPPIRPGARVGQGVVLNNPWLRAIVVPDSYDPPSRSSRSSLYTGGSFSWLQSVRG